MPSMPAPSDAPVLTDENLEKLKQYATKLRSGAMPSGGNFFGALIAELLKDYRLALVQLRCAQRDSDDLVALMKLLARDDPESSAVVARIVDQYRNRPKSSDTKI